MPVTQSIPYHKNSDYYFSRLKDLPFSCWLDSGRPACDYGRYDIISALPLVRIVTDEQKSSIFDYEYLLEEWALKHEAISESIRELLRENSQQDPFDLLAKELNSLSPTKDCSIPFCGGAIGYFSYDLGRRYHGLDQHSGATTEPVSNQFSNLGSESNPKQGSTPNPKQGRAFAQMNIGLYHWALVQDHLLQTAWLVSLPECDPKLLELVRTRINQTQPAPPVPLHVESLESNTTKQEYLTKLARINDYILAGDCYQVNLSQCFQGEYSGSPYSAYQLLREAMASPFSAYLNIGNETILSLSPERFLQVKGRQVLTQPIKGTSKRHDHEETDQQRAIDLRNSDKNRAENLMIVDLLRNDLGHDCIPGSIQVDQLFGLQSFPNVHHLVSDISGILKEEAQSLRLLRDCFPGGSITGAPKKRAMEIIDELESNRRGVYCGSIGYINNNGDMDTNIAIRTVSCDGKTLYCNGGGGIVADSDPEEEYQESLDKVARILETLKGK